MKVQDIEKSMCREWILKKHYAKRLPSISYAYGLISDSKIIGICTYGSPPSPSLCDGICGKQYASKVIELNRLCLLDNIKNGASFLVGNSLKLLPKPSIVVSYADTSKNHHGYIYQASNFIYTGLSDKRTEWQMKGSNLHSKTICEKYTLEERLTRDDFIVVERPRKHRYIYFCGDKKQKKELLSNLKYEVSDYPKGNNVKYDASYIPKDTTLLI